jgi:hypothetical protein
MPGITSSLVWTLTDPEGVQTVLRTPQEFSKACQLYQADPKGYSLEQRNFVELKA